jgi:hypothetical protein
LVAGASSATAQDNFYAVGYFTNNTATGAPDAELRLTNDGSYIFGEPANLCANIYVFDNAEEMVECCSCLVTPDGELDLDVHNDLTGNIVDAGVRPNRGIIGVISSNVPDSGSATCTPTGVAFGESAPWDLHTGIRGWLTHIQATGGTPAFGITETNLTDSYLNTSGEIESLFESCFFVLQFQGACSCKDASQ